MSDSPSPAGLEKLKELAETLLREKAAGRHGDEYYAALGAYGDVCAPKTILSLVGEIERLRAANAGMAVLGRYAVLPGAQDG